MKEAIKKRTVFEKVITEIMINGKNTVTVLNIDELKGHTGGAFHGIFSSTGRAKTTVTAERNEFQFSTMRTAVHGTAERGITTV